MKVGLLSMNGQLDCVCLERVRELTFIEQKGMLAKNHCCLWGQIFLGFNPNSDMY